MKKLKFLVNIPDKYTGERYEKGQIKEFKDERAKEILAARRVNGEVYAVLIEEEIETATIKPKVEKAVKKTRKVKSIELDLDKGTVKENYDI